jgi:hypothetical protein
VALHETFERRPHQLDWLGAATLGAGVSSFLLGLFEIGGGGMGDALGAGPLLLLAAGLLGFFLWWETRAPEPLLPLSLFRLRVVSAGSVLTFIAGVAIFGIASYVALFVQGVLGGTPVEAGLAILPIDLWWLLASMVCGRWMLRYGTRLTVMLGMTVLAAATFAASRLSADVPILVFALVTGPSGFGLGCIIAPLTIAVQSAVAWEQRGVATASSVFARTIGGSVGMAVLGVVLNAQLLALLDAAGLAGAADGGQPSRGAQLGDVAQLLDPVERAALAPETLLALRGALEQGIHSVFLLMALAAFVGIAVSWLLPAHGSERVVRRAASGPPADTAVPSPATLSEGERTAS